MIKTIGVLFLVLVVTGSSGAGAAPEAAPSCSIRGVEEKSSLTSFQQLPPPMRSSLSLRFESWDEELGPMFSTMTPRGGEWSSATTPFEASTRRFISGGHRQQRWYVFYEHGGYGGHTYHVAIVDIAPSAKSARIVSHIVLPAEDACDYIQRFIDNPGAPGPGLDDGEYW